MLGGSPALLFLSHFSLFLAKPRGHCSLTRRNKVKQDEVPWDLEAGDAGHLGVRVGGRAARRAGQAGGLVLGQRRWPCLHWSDPETAGCPVLCWVTDGKPFQKGHVACTPACYCTLWTHQSKPGLNWASLHFVLVCHVDMLSVYKCHDSFTNHRRFTSLLLFLCQYSRYISLGSNI